MVLIEELKKMGRVLKNAHIAKEVDIFFVLELTKSCIFEKCSSFYLMLSEISWSFYLYFVSI